MKIKRIDILSLTDFEDRSYRHCLTDIYAFAGREFNPEPPYLSLVIGSGNFRVADMEPGKHWEYPYAIINAGLKPGLRAADCGSGKGILQFYLAHLGCRVTAIDEKTFHSKKLEKCYQLLNRMGIPLGKDPAYFIKRSARKLGVSIEFVNCSILDLDVTGDLFDRVFCISVIEHIPDELRPAALARLAGSVKPGGLLILTVDYSPSGADGSLSDMNMRHLISGIDPSWQWRPPVPPADWPDVLNRINRWFNQNLKYTSLGMIIEK